MPCIMYIVYIYIIHIVNFKHKIKNYGYNISQKIIKNLKKKIIIKIIKKNNNKNY